VRRALLLALSLGLVAATAHAAESPAQGSLLLGEAPAGSKVTLDGKALHVTPDGHYVFGVGRTAGPVVTVEITAPDGKRTRQEIRIAKRDWQIDRVDGVPEQTVSPSAADLARIKSDAQRVAAARLADSDERGWLERFVWPVTGRISGIYGSQRILNGRPFAPHLGVDIAAPAGTPIRAPADGVVTLADADQFLTGGTVLLDHGHGVNSVYAHLQKIAVKIGDHLKQGDVIGELGMTGRATGPNLHWGVSWFTTGVDPALLLPPMPPGPSQSGH
jgi:murein DD-endopeptidase MepM/ murein hydrolase activator NlpD